MIVSFGALNLLTDSIGDTWQVKKLSKAAQLLSPKDNVEALKTARAELRVLVKRQNQHIEQVVFFSIKNVAHDN